METIKDLCEITSKNFQFGDDAVKEKMILAAIQSVFCRAPTQFSMKQEIQLASLHGISIT